MSWKLFSKKRGVMEFGQLLPAIQVLGILAILGAVFIVILSQLQNSSLISGDATAVASVNASKWAIRDILVVWLPIIVIVLVASILIFMLIKNLMGGGQR